jgi:hypothetical protein
MRLLDRSGLGSLLTLVVYLLAACTAEQAPVPSPSPLSVPGPRSNLLLNSDFLQGTSSWEASRDPSGPSLVLAYDQAGFVTLDVGPSAALQTGGWVQTLGVQPGACYRASYRVHTESLVGWAGMRLSFYDAGGGLLWETGGAPATGDTPWATRAWRFRAPRGAALARVWLGVEAAGSGRAAFDEPCLAADDAPVARALIVDYGRVAGQVRSFQQVNYGPLGSAPAGLLDHSQGRPHVAAVNVDVTAVFPNPWADPADPASYHFDASDAAVAAAEAAGGGILCRLVDGPAVTGRRTGAPVWGQVAQHIAMHYNEGWAGGYRYDIRYWEVCCDAGQLNCRGPLADSYYGLLAATIGAFSALDPGLRVGGPGLAGAEHESFLEGLLAYLAQRELRPGFLSWQVDSDGAPWAAAAAEAAIERLLDRHGLSGTQVIVSDWGTSVGASYDPEDSAREAAQLVASATCWQDTRLSLAFRSWPGMGTAPGLLAAGGGLSPLGRAFLLMGRFEDTPRRVAVQGGDQLGYALLAGKSKDGKLVQVAIADTGSRSEEYRLALAGFPQGFHYVVREISGGCAGDVVAYGSDADLAEGVLALPWRSPAVHWIEISWDE